MAHLKIIKRSVPTSKKTFLYHKGQLLPKLRTRPFT